MRTVLVIMGLLMMVGAWKAPDVTDQARGIFGLIGVALMARGLIKDSSTD